MFKKKGEVKEYTGFFGRHKFWMAVTTLIGTIVGAGILALPYVVGKAGFLYGTILMLVLGVIMVFVNLFVGEIVLRTKEQHQLTGYAEKYLGKLGKNFMCFTLVFSIYGALIAYLIGEGVSLRALFGGGSALIFSLLFFLAGLVIVYKGVKATGKTELILFSLLCVVIFLTGFFSFENINFFNLTTNNLAYLFFPYGVILFAYIGSAAIPEMQEVLGNDKKLMKKAIIIGSLIPVFLYILFTFVVLGIVGLDNFELLEPNQKIATVALSMYSSVLLGKLANLIAILTMFTSFLTLSIALIEIYEYDYNFSRSKALVLTYLLPLIVVFLGITSFIKVIGITGAIAGGLEGILIILMYWKAKKKWNRSPEYSLPTWTWLGYFIIILFSLGIIYQIWATFFS